MKIMNNVKFKGSVISCGSCVMLHYVWMEGIRDGLAEEDKY